MAIAAVSVWLDVMFNDRGNILLSLYIILLSKTIHGTILGIIMIMVRHVLGIMHQINSEHGRIMGNFIFDIQTIELLFLSWFI